MPVLPWKQGVHGNKLTMNSKDLCTKYEVISEELQKTKFEMYASVAMVTILPYQQVKKNLLSLLEGTCLPSMKVKCQSSEGKFLKIGRPKNTPRHLPDFVLSYSGKIVPLMPISS